MAGMLAGPRHVARGCPQHLRLDPHAVQPCCHTCRDVRSGKIGKERTLPSPLPFPGPVRGRDSGGPRDKLRSDGSLSAGPLLPVTAPRWLSVPSKKPRKQLLLLLGGSERKPTPFTGQRSATVPPACECQGGSVFPSRARTPWGASVPADAADGVLCDFRVLGEKLGIQSPTGPEVGASTPPPARAEPSPAPGAAAEGPGQERPAARQALVSGGPRWASTWPLHGWGVSPVPGALGKGH